MTTSRTTRARTRGVLFVHSAPPALCPHVEWAIGGVLGVRASLDWSRQPAEPGLLRSELSWAGRVGSAAALTSALLGWSLRFEVTEDPVAGGEGERYAVTPRLGIFRAVIGAHGDILVPENRLRAAMAATAAGDDAGLAAALDDLLGRAWDEELEPFRYAGDGAPVRWLHQVV